MQLFAFAVNDNADIALIDRAFGVALYIPLIAFDRAEGSLFGSGGCNLKRITALRAILEKWWMNLLPVSFCRAGHAIGRGIRNGSLAVCTLFMFGEMFHSKSKKVPRRVWRFACEATPILNPLGRVQTNMETADKSVL